MVMKVYYNMASPVARATILVLKLLKIPYEAIHVDLLKGEHKSEEFVKLNPQHTVPTIQEDDGFVMWESHATNAYLVGTYSESDELYPKEPKIRAVVDQRLHFDTGVLFTAIRNVVVEILVKKTVTKMTDELIASIEEGYSFLEIFLKGSQYIAADHFTIADFSIISTLCNSNVLAPIKEDKFPLLSEYRKRCESNIPHLKKLNEEGSQRVADFFKIVNFELPSQE